MAEDLCLQCSKKEIEGLKQAVEETFNFGSGSQYPTLTYEDGIQETLRWLFEGGDHPYMGARLVVKSEKH